MRSDYDAHEDQRRALVRPTWAEPSRCVRRPVRRLRARLLYLLPLAVAILAAAIL